MTAQSVRLTNVDIDNALENGHLDVVFQPVVSLSDRSILRHEVFVRWDHPGLGALPPGAFISFFEAQGRIGDLTRYVLSQAVQAYDKAGKTDAGGISINLSPADVADEGLSDAIHDVLDGSALTRQDLLLECPTFAADMPVAEQLSRYEALAAIGCPLCLEIRTRTIPEILNAKDFPFAEVKTSGSHILRYARSSRGGPGLAAIADLVAFARSKKVRTVAVGIEDEAGALALKKVGFDAGQGKALGRAGPTLTPTKEETSPPVTSGEALVKREKPTENTNRALEIARRAAARKKELQRFNAATPARALQHQLKKQFLDSPQADDLSPPLPETPVESAVDRNDTQAEIVPEFASLLEELPPTFIARASAHPNLSFDPTAEESPPEEAAEDDSPALIDEEVRFVVPTNPTVFRLPTVLRKKYRITHFWPRSWKRAWRRAKEARKSTAERQATQSPSTDET